MAKSLNEICDSLSDKKLIVQALENNGVPDHEIFRYLLSRNMIKGLVENVDVYSLLVVEEAPNQLFIIDPNGKCVDLHIPTLIKTLESTDSISILNEIKSFLQRSGVTLNNANLKAGQRNGKK